MKTLTPNPIERESSNVTKPLMKPLRSSALALTRHGEGERFTRSASSTLEIRAFSCSTARSFQSIESVLREGVAGWELPDIQGAVSVIAVKWTQRVIL